MAEGDDGFTRRDFLQLVTSAMAAAGLSGCNAPPREILPYARPTDGPMPGIPLHFATAWSIDGRGSALLVESREGRPIKIEGNPEHPINRGAASAFDQASLLDLYGPDRLRAISESGAPRSRDSLAKAIGAMLDKARADGGARL